MMTGKSGADVDPRSPANPPYPAPMPYVGIRWLADAGGGVRAIANPANAGPLGELPLVSDAELDVALGAVARAAAAWAHETALARATALLADAARLRESADALAIDEAIKAKNRTKSRIRSRAEHSIGVIKRVLVTAALADIFLVRYTVLGAVRPQ